LSSSKDVQNGITDYSKLYHEADTATRVTSYKQLVNSYYDLATVFYEWGWCTSFHFAYRYVPSETFTESIRRHEYTLAAQLTNCYGPDKRVLDVGCGIAGPARTISKFLRCQVTGITLNPYQVQRGNELNDKDPFSTVRSVEGDFMELPFAAEYFDGAYAIEATCHAPDRVKCYHEVWKVLKPGATFCNYEWCMTDQYDPTNPEHLRLKEVIEEGNGLPDIVTTTATVVHVEPWMTPLMPSWNIFSQRFQFNCVGAVVTNVAIYLLELVRLAPAGTVQTQKILQAGGFALRDAGQEGIFTTMYMMVGRKP
jgi:sterol 24-C-methyltransferase